jgi:hypothetical protein
VVAGKGAINPFAKRCGGLAWADGKSHADGVVLPPQCGGGGEWDNGSINVRANMASICAIICDILAIEYWGQKFSVIALENGAVELGCILLLALLLRLALDHHSNPGLRRNTP